MCRRCLSLPLPVTWIGSQRLYDGVTFHIAIIYNTRRLSSETRCGAQCRADRYHKLQLRTPTFSSPTTYQLTLQTTDLEVHGNAHHFPYQVDNREDERKRLAARCTCSAVSAEITTVQHCGGHSEIQRPTHQLDQGYELRARPGCSTSAVHNHWRP